MAKRGRPRKQGVNRSSGRIRKAERTPQTAPVSCVIAARIARGATKDNARDQRHGYELGRLWLAGKLSLPSEPAERAEERHRAGEMLATLAGRFRARGGFPKPTPRAANMEAVRASRETDDDPDAWRRLQLAYDNACRAIPRDSVTTVWRVVMMDEADTPERDLPALLSGLMALAGHFGVWGDGALGRRPRPVRLAPDVRSRRMAAPAEPIIPTSCAGLLTSPQKGA